MDAKISGVIDNTCAVILSLFSTQIESSSKSRAKDFSSLIRILDKSYTLPDPETLTPIAGDEMDSALSRVRSISDVIAFIFAQMPATLKSSSSPFVIRYPLISLTLANYFFTRIILSAILSTISAAFSTFSSVMY